MVGPLKAPRTNFHNIADLAASSSTPYSRQPLQAGQYSGALLNTESPRTSLKVKMEPSPAQSLTVVTPSHRLRFSPTHSPAVSEDSGYAADASPLLAHALQSNSIGSLPKHTPLSRAEHRRKYRKQRSVFEGVQLKTLETMFDQNAYPSAEEYEALSDRVSIDESRLRIWFQNRRARHRRSTKPADAGSKPSGTAHSLHHPSLPHLHNHMMMLTSPHLLCYPTGFL